MERLVRAWVGAFGRAATCRPRVVLLHHGPGLLLSLQLLKIVSVLYKTLEIRQIEASLPERHQATDLREPKLRHTHARKVLHVASRLSGSRGLKPPPLAKDRRSYSAIFCFPHLTDQARTHLICAHNLTPPHTRHFFPRLHIKSHHHRPSNEAAYRAAGERIDPLASVCVPATTEVGTRWLTGLSLPQKSYATRSSTVVLVDATGRMKVVERNLGGDRSDGTVTKGGKTGTVSKDDESAAAAAAMHMRNAARNTFEFCDV